MDEDTDLTDDQIEEETGIKQEDIDEQKVEVDLHKIDGILVFETKEEAEEQAEKLGCKGHTSMKKMVRYGICHANHMMTIQQLLIYLKINFQMKKLKTF